MSGDYKHIIEPLRKIKADIDTFGLNDPEELQEVCMGLEVILSDIPAQMPQVLHILSLCLKELENICQGGAMDTLASVDAIFESLSAAEHYLLDDPAKEAFLSEANQLLENVMTGLPSRSDAGPSASSEDFVNASLNDAASLLLQIGPKDFDEIERLGELLEIIGTDDACTNDCFEYIIQALQKIRWISEKNRSGSIIAIPDDALAHIEHLIEKAMKSVSETASCKEKTVTQENNSPSPEDSPFESSCENYMPEDADLELIGEFIAESSDLITSAEEALLALETDPEDMEAVSTVFRAFHNIKGTSAFFELALMTEMAHHAESLLSRVRDQEIRYAGGYPDLALRSVDMLKDLFRVLQDALEGKPFLKPKGYDELFAMLSAPEEAGLTDQPEERTDFSLETNHVMEISDMPPQEMPPEKAYLPEETKEFHISSDQAPLEKSTEIFPDNSPKQPPHGLRPNNRKVVESSIRVPIERLDRFIDMVGELVVSHSMVAQDKVVASGEHHALVKKVAHTSKIVRELQGMSMSMRMIPLKATFRKMARLVRDLSRKIGKDVRFLAEGEDTEIDRNMVDIINDPLVHMVRNALDHGIEIPEKREKAGKPRSGTVSLSAFHSAGNVVVEIRDDGQGLNRDMILAKAFERGLIEDGTGFSDREVYNLIFEPGFSTAQMVSDVSGRGVGMDVVKRNIEAIRGHVEIQSVPGKGSLFKMSLPLTLAIIDGMVVRVGCEKYVIPTISIVRSVQPSLDDLSTVLRKGEMLSLQGKLIPLFRLAELFSIKKAVKELTSAIIVVVENDGHQAGLMVDELIGSQQIVIKTLGETLGSITGISGSAIMPNGRVGLILDVGGIVRLAHEQ